MIPFLDDLAKLLVGGCAFALWGLLIVGVFG